MTARHTKSCIRGAIAVLLIFFFTASLSALDVPPLTDRVVDLANVLSESDEATIASFLGSVDGQTGVQLAVLTIPSLEGESLEGYSIRVADAWKLGQKDRDNGVLLLVSIGDRAVRIEVGYGLEGTLTDAASGLIIRNVIAPRFREGKYAEGIYEATRNIVGLATDNAEIVAEEVKNPRKEKSGNGLAAFVFFVFFMIIMRAGRNRRGGGGILGPLILGSMLSGGSRQSGGGFSGGGFGGGFSGGGGGFGGGGSSGGW